MKPSTKTTLSRKPQGEAERLGVARFLHVVDLCFQAFVLDIRLEVFPEELEKIFDDEVRERIVREVSKITRMVSFVSYHGDHMFLDIRFSEGGRDVKQVGVRFDFQQKQLIFITEALL
jgi:hypothetical protein